MNEPKFNVLNHYSIYLLFPTPALIYLFGTLYTRIRIDQKRLGYLHRILNREASNWTKKTLDVLANQNIGWFKGIKKTLEEYALPENFTQIQAFSVIEWKNTVRTAVEEQNRKRLIEDCKKRLMAT